MGWFGHGKYDGDMTSSVQAEMVEVVANKFKIPLFDKKGKEIDLDDLYLVDVSKGFLNQETAQKIVSHIDFIEKKVLNKTKTDTFIFDEDDALAQMMVADFYMNHKLEMPESIQKKSIQAVELLNGEHAEEFSSVSARRRVLNKFINQLKNYPLVVEDSTYGNVQQNNTDTTVQPTPKKNKPR